MTTVPDRHASLGRRIAPLAALVVAVPMTVVVIDYWWHASGNAATLDRIEGDGSATMAPVLSSVLSDSVPRSADLNEWCVHLEAELAHLPAVDDAESIERGTLLLLLGDARLALGQSASARAEYEDVLKLDVDRTHWQARDAAARLTDVDDLEQRPETDRALWRQAFDEQRQAERLHHDGRYLEAADHARRALQTRRQLWGPDHRETAESLLRLGWLYTEHADVYLRAEDVLIQARNACELSYGAVHPSTGDCLYLLATLADDRGEFDAADALYEQALQVYRETVGELSRRYARALNRQGRMYNDWWKDYAQGKSYRALQIREQVLGKDHPDCAESLEDLAEANIGLIHFQEAEKLLLRAIDIRQRYQGANHPDLAQPECLLGVCLIEMGDAAQAYVKLRHALDVTGRAHGARHPLTGRQQLWMGMQYVGHLDTAESYRLLQQTADDYAAIGLTGNPVYLQALYEQGNCLEQEFGFRHDDSDTALVEQTIRKNIEAVAACRAVPGGTTLPTYANALTSLHDSYYTENYQSMTRDKARELLVEAERVCDENGGVYNPAYRWVFLQWGRWWMSQGRYPDATKAFNRFEELTRMQYSASAHPWRYAAALRAMAGLYLHEQADPERVYRYGDELDQIMQGYFRSNAPAQSDFSRLAILGATYFNLCANLTAAESRNEQTRFYDQVLGIRGAATTFQAADRIAHDHAELAPLLTSVRAARQELKAALFAPEATDSHSDWLQQLRDAATRKKLAEDELAVAARPSVPPYQPINWKQLQGVLPPGAAFIDFIDYLHHGPPADHRGHLLKQRRVLVFVLGPTGEPRCIPLGATADIRTAVDDWRRAIDDFQAGRPADIDAVTGRLSRLIWEPLAPAVADAQTLFIAPVGPLCFVSFAALPGRNEGEFLLQDYQLDYVSSGQMLYEILTSAPASSGRGCLLAGGIDYQAPELVATRSQRSADSPPSIIPPPGAWPNLEASAYEIEQIAQVANDAGGIRTSSLTGKDADLSHFTDALGDGWSYLHFAGHGFFADSGVVPGLTGRYFETDDPGSDSMLRNQLLLSGIVLAPDREHPAEPPILTAEDVGSLDLRGVDLVVLSACETGLGSASEGDGVLGLTRAFRTAGARTVISSLWKVDDAATSLLMEQFYRNLLQQHLSRSEALRQAQLQLLTSSSEQLDRRQRLLVDRGFQVRGIHTGETRYVGEAATTHNRRIHPALWAAFILSGDGR